MRSKIAVGGLTVVVALLLATNPVVVDAAGQITSGDIKNNTIKSKDIKDNQIKSADVKDGGLTAADVAPNTFLAANGTATNSSLLGGLKATDLVRADAASTTINTNPAATFTQTVNPVVVAPVKGQLQFSIMVSCASFNGTTDTRWDVQARVDNVVTGSTAVFFFPHVNVNPSGDSVTLVGQASVNPGNHALSLSGTRSNGNGSMDCNIGSTSLFVPFKDDGTQRPADSAATTGRGASLN